MEYLIGVSIWFALIWTSGAILGYIYATEHSGPKKQKRDAKGRFVGKGSIDLAHYDISIWGSKRASYPGRKK